MGKIERVERNVSVLNVLRIAHALNTTFNELSRSDNSMEAQKLTTRYGFNLQALVQIDRCAGSG